MLEKLSDLGITLLLFLVGLKLDLRTIARPQVWAVASVHMSIVVLVLGTAIHVLALLGASFLTGIDFPQLRRGRGAAQGGREGVRARGRVRACLVDRRETGKVRHTLTDLLNQRIFGIACGHPDGNDADHLADDPIHKLLLGRDPVAGAPLASQPTISRFENCATRTARGRRAWRRARRR